MTSQKRENSMSEPTVGQIVHFFPGEVSVEEETPLAAMVLGIYEDGDVDLNVFKRPTATRHNANILSERKVPRREKKESEGDNKALSGGWEFTSAAGDSSSAAPGELNALSARVDAETHASADALVALDQRVADNLARHHELKERVEGAELTVSSLVSDVSALEAASREDPPSPMSRVDNGEPDAAA